MTNLHVVATLLLVATAANSVPLKDEKAVFCYFGSWATYRTGAGNFEVNNIDTKLCTHVVYAFAGLNPDNNFIKSLDPWNDLDVDGGKGNYKKIIKLKQVKPDLKVLLAIGGWNEGSVNYSLMSQSKNDRADFVESVVKFLKKYKFDGLDVDWEYPTQRGGVPEDKENFVTLLEELNTAFKSNNLMLSIAAGAFDPEDIYDIKAIGSVVDYVNLMTFDYVTPSSTDETGLHASLVDVKQSVQAWLAAGFPKNKLNIGVPFHARTFLLSDPDDNDLGSLIDGPGQQGKFTKEAGTLSYYEVLGKLEDGDWTLVKGDKEVAQSYASRGSQWMCYDDEDSVSLKANYVLEEGLAGIMVWAIDFDDFRGTYADNKYPLLTKVYNILNK